MRNLRQVGVSAAQNNADAAPPHVEAAFEDGREPQRAGRLYDHLHPFQQVECGAGEGGVVDGDHRIDMREHQGERQGTKTQRPGTVCNGVGRLVNGEQCAGRERPRRIVAGRRLDADHLAARQAMSRHERAPREQATAAAGHHERVEPPDVVHELDRKSTRLNSSH